MSTLDALFLSLQRRLRPEDVAEMVLDELGHSLSSEEEELLQRAAAGSLKRGMHQFTSMLQDFQKPIGPILQVERAHVIFTTPFELSDDAIHDPDQVAAVIARLSGEIRKVVGASDFKAHRFTREGRAAQGMDISKRRYNKMFRFLARFERKLSTYRMELRKYAATRIAKSGLATLIPREDFIASADAACFVAYYSAVRNRRSVFTNQKQAPAFDELAAMLLRRFRRQPCAGGWRAIAQVMPDAEIVAALSDADKLALFAEYLAQLQEIAELLCLTWMRSNLDRSTMIVRRGDDSTTWNTLAGAWNAARQGWLALALALGMDTMVDALCLGKVMRLMAADVAAWHRATGGTLEPDTLVWAELPAPWEVLTGEATCTRAQVEAICAKHGVDPVAKGWTAPRAARSARPYTPTPELVHGVAVGHPTLAAAMRRAGWFSGKSPAHPGLTIMHEVAKVPPPSE